MRRPRLWAAAAAALLAPALALAACGEKPQAQPEPGGSAAASGATARSSSSAPLATASGSGSASAAKSALAGTWTGKYTTKRHKIEMPPDAGDKTWTKDDGTAAVGDSTIEIVIADSGDATGSSKGAIGDVKVRGRAEEQSLRASVTPANPNDEKSLTGYVDLDVKDGKLVGVLHASGPNAVVVREASVTLERK